MPGGLTMGGLGGMSGMASLGMDDMMSKMMSNMNSMKMGSTSTTKKISSSSFSSSSSSLSSSMSSRMMGNGMSSLPPMRGMEMPGLSFEEMPSMPLSSSMSQKPEYTVTSPPVSPPAEMTHSVKSSDDVKKTSSEVNDSVLLKFKEGSDYKLALNMQQFSPDDITIKLNGQELTIEAEGAGEKFAQKHFIPYNIDLDNMTSSFSSDGVLVIRAPKKQ